MITPQILALYLGCQCVTKYVDWGEWGNPITMKLSTLQRLEDDLSFQVKPILRPLSSMTEEEALECGFGIVPLSLRLFHKHG